MEKLKNANNSNNRHVHAALSDNGTNHDGGETLYLADNPLACGGIFGHGINHDDGETMKHKRKLQVVVDEAAMKRTKMEEEMKTEITPFPTNATETTMPSIIEANNECNTGGSEKDNETAKSRARSSRGCLTTCGKPGEQRWRSHQMTEDYINLVGNMMLPSMHLAPFGYDPTLGQYPIESITALGLLLSPLRRPTVVERWSPYEISIFEASLALCGKEFHQVQKFVKTKNTKEIIEFYYVWKKTAHYRVWKKQYISPEDETQFDDSDYDD